MGQYNSHLPEKPLPTCGQLRQLNRCMGTSKQPASLEDATVSSIPCLTIWSGPPWDSDESLCAGVQNDWQYERKAFSNSNASACDIEMRGPEGGALNN